MEWIVLVKRFLCEAPGLFSPPGMPLPPVDGNVRKANMIRRTLRTTVEGERKDNGSVGQTVVAQDLRRRIRPRRVWGTTACSVAASGLRRFTRGCGR